MAELLRANPDAARAGAYDLNFVDGAAGCAKGGGSTRAQLDLGQWLADVCETLSGSGSGSVKVTRSGDLYSAVIAVRWNDRRARERLGEGGNAWETFTYRAGL
jgi:type IV pilus assembly protein PilV